MAVDDRARGDARALQVTAWRGQQQIALLSPAAGGPTPSADAVRIVVDRLRQSGVQRVLTGALHQREVPSFMDAGFGVHDHLHLLRHDLVKLPTTTSTARVRRARRGDRAQVLHLDQRAFDAFWTLDDRGLTDAIRATPASRFRVATDGRGPVTGYTVTGLAADRGYLQRLAIDPDRHREGIGVSLVANALQWLVRRHARLAVVNTQEGNTAALGLYDACGFVLEPHGLTVLALDLEPDHPAGAP